MEEGSGEGRSVTGDPVGNDADGNDVAGKQGDGNDAPAHDAGGNESPPGVSMLGRDVGTREYGRLEFFEVQRPVRVTFRTDELEALCPAVAGIQPDIYRAEIAYTALTHAIESKSLKLWLVSFRDRRIFAEHLVAEIHDVIAAHSPAVSDVSVRLTQNPRGGITTVVEHPPPA